MDTDARSDTAQSSDVVEQQWFIDRFQELHARGEERVTLINVYKELPIANPAVIFDIRGNRVELQTSGLQLAAISQCSEAYIKCAAMESTVLGRLAGMDVRRNLVQLIDFRLETIEVEKRSTVRVRLKKPVKAIIHLGSELINGVIHDVSVGGSCIKTMKRDGLAEAGNVSIEFELHPGLKADVDCTLVKIFGDAAPYQCSFRFNHTTHTEEVLSHFVYERQREILKELREAL